MIQLQPRDREILRVCYEQQFLTWEHVHAFFDTHRTIPYRRIGVLKKEGFLTAHYHPLLGKTALIRLTQLGTHLAEQGYTFQIPQLRQLNPSTLIHDALVTSVRLKLSELWDAKYIPERAIKMKEFKEIPDGLFYFPSKKMVALEIENSDKGKFRFLKLLDRWKKHEAIGAVLYVASHPNLFRVLKHYLEQAQFISKPLIALVLWDDLKEGLPLAITQFGNADIFSKRDLFS